MNILEYSRQVNSFFEPFLQKKKKKERKLPRVITINIENIFTNNLKTKKNFHCQPSFVLLFFFSSLLLFFFHLHEFPHFLAACPHFDDFIRPNYQVTNWLLTYIMHDTRLPHRIFMYRSATSKSQYRRIVNMPSVVTLKSWTRFQREDRLINLSSGLCSCLIFLNWRIIR